MVETIVFGGGCFWCIEAVYQMLHGVTKVTSGYAGGEEKTARYFSVINGDTGHAEVVEVQFDPAVITLENILAVFFTSHDPTSVNKQGADTGPEYRSVIFYTTLAQKTAAENYVKKLTTEKVYQKPIVTTVEALSGFFPAEDYHQNYYQNNYNANPYCQVVIDPKIVKIRQSFAHLLKKNG